MRLVDRAVGSLLLILLVASGAVSEAGAQHAHHGQGPTAETRARNALINGAIGMGIVGVRQLIRGEFDLRQLGQGAAGGVVLGAAKQITATEFDGSGFVGRQVHAIGIALITSAGADSFRIAFPVGPTQLVYAPRGPTRFRMRADLVDVVVPLVSLADPDQRFDARASLSAGAPVFQRPTATMPLGHDDAAGFALLGTLYLSNEISGPYRRSVLAHEAVHLLQGDAYRQLVTYPVERYVLSRLPLTREAVRYVDVGLLAPVSVAALAIAIPYERRFWEREAYGLVGR